MSKLQRVDYIDNSARYLQWFTTFRRQKEDFDKCRLVFNQWGATRMFWVFFNEWICGGFIMNRLKDEKESGKHLTQKTAQGYVYSVRNTFSLY